MSADALAVRQRLNDPVRLCRALDLLDGSKRQSGGLLVRCPSHNERTPSCSVTLGPDGTVRARCFACDFTADALGLIAQVRGLSLRSDFAGVLAAAAELAGDAPVIHRTVFRPEPTHGRPYPPRGQVLALWDAASRVDSCADAWELLTGRAIDVGVVGDLDLARSLPVDATVPRWARYQGGSWVGLGYRLVLPMFDHRGDMLSIRAWRVEENRDAEFPVEASFEEVRAAQAEREPMPKRLPPAGHRSTGLVMTNAAALEMLRGKAKPTRLIVAEGEPDFLTRSVTNANDAVIGIVSGSWGSDSPFAKSVPLSTEVYLFTHPDAAGQRYREAITASMLRHQLFTEE